LNSVRIENAKKLLKDDCYSIYQVSGMVGYANVQTFIRIFKKIEGITPGEYRKMNESFLT
jgi:two-component system response regulator YesN